LTLLRASKVNRFLKHCVACDNSNAYEMGHHFIRLEKMNFVLNFFENTAWQFYGLSAYQVLH